MGKCSDIQVGSKVKVIDDGSQWFRYRGTVSELHVVENVSQLTGEMFTDVVGITCTLHAPGKEEQVKAELKLEQVACIQKKFIDIEQLREGAIDLGEGISRKPNDGAFEAGDIIQITEKIDGANASIAWNPDEGKFEIFSRTNLLDGTDGLRGFKTNMELSVIPKILQKHTGHVSREESIANYVIFGEWLVPHTVQYEKDRYGHWYVYDVWDKAAKNYLPQEAVKALCTKYELEYVHVLYEGPFISWDHCRSFGHKNTYGENQEGVVVKNQTKLNADNVRFPKYLKIVNKEFLESHVKAHKEPKVIDPEQLKLEAEAKAKMSEIVTIERVKKMVLKCVDEGLVPESLEPKHIGILMKTMPKRIYDDCIKEEPEMMASVGALAGKLCSAFTAQHVKAIVLGV